MPNKNTPVIIWLAILAFIVFAMIIVGGITRLTNSGLSITDWQPIMGVVPPLNEQDWTDVFEKYKQFPEYQTVNQGMMLSDFKSIYLWEYVHRLIARAVAFVFLIPWAFFVIKKRISGKLNLKLLFLFVLGGLQGALGWYMVKSGLIDMPRVSHYRLAAHLALALALLGATVWQIQNLRYSASTERSSAPRLLKKLALSFTILLSLQIFYGALVAGLDAGIGYNTFPKMAGEWVPPYMFIIKPLWRDLFENNTTVQFLHRTFGWLMLFATAEIWWRARKSDLTPRQTLSINLLTGVVALQFLLGILTVIYVVPVPLAASHQAVAALLLVTAINVNHALRSPAAK